MPTSNTYVAWPLLRRARQNRGLSQTAMAMKLGYASRNAYSQKERGLRCVPVEEALRMARILGGSVEELFSQAE